MSLELWLSQVMGREKVQIQRISLPVWPPGPRCPSSGASACLLLGLVSPFWLGHWLYGVLCPVGLPDCSRPLRSHPEPAFASLSSFFMLRPVVFYRFVYHLVLERCLKPTQILGNATDATWAWILLCLAWVSLVGKDSCLGQQIDGLWWLPKSLQIIPLPRTSLCCISFSYPWGFSLDVTSLH